MTQVIFCYSLVQNPESNQKLLLLGNGLGVFFLMLFLFLWLMQKKRLQFLNHHVQQNRLQQEDLKESLLSAGIGIWNWDLKQNQIFWDEEVYKILGVKREAFNGKYEEFLQLIAPGDVESTHQKIQESIQSKKPLNITYKTDYPHGKLRFITLKAKFDLDENGQTSKLNGICWDITPIERSRHFIELYAIISKILSESETLSQACLALIQVLKNNLNWDVLVIFLMDEATHLLHCTAFATAPGLKFSNFEGKIRSSKLGAGSSLANRVWSTYRINWIKDAPKDTNFAFNVEAKLDGIHGALGIPIFEDDRLIGVLEFFRKELLEEDLDEDLKNLMTAIGLGISQFIKKKNAQDARNELFQAVTFSSEGIFKCSAEGLIKSWNQGAEKIYGWTEKEIIGQSIEKLFLIEHRKQMKGLLEQVQKEIPVERLNIQHLNKDQKPLWVQLTASPIIDKSQAPKGFLMIVENITEDEKVRSQLKQVEEKFQAFATTTQEWVWETDANLNYIYANPGIQKILGYPCEEVLGRTLFSLLLDEDKIAVENVIHECKSKKNGWSQLEARYVDKKGVVRWLESNAQPILNEKMEFAGFRGSGRDVTERRKLEKAKNEFVSMISHEMRTPLTAIQGAVSLIIAKDQLSNELRKLAQIALKSSKSLLSIINDILDLQRIQLGLFPFQMRKVDIVEIVKDAICSYQNQHHELQDVLVEEKPYYNADVYTDPTKIAQVFTHLLDNAVKFSRPQGKIYISIQKVHHHVRVSIRDEGLGIPAHFRPNIFRVFSQANSTDARIAGGVGLGLSFSKVIIESLNGLIDFESQEGIGSTFFFDLPIQSG